MPVQYYTPTSTELDALERAEHRRRLRDADDDYLADPDLAELADESGRWLTEHPGKPRRIRRPWFPGHCAR